VTTIEFNGVSHSYTTAGTTKQVLRDIDLCLDERRVGVIGANGSGKSTFARMLNALVVPTSGRVRVDGLDTAREARAIRRRVGFCFTNPDSQIVMPTVAEDVAFSLRRHRLGRTETAARVAATLAAYGLAGHADHPAHLLSGGQKQLLALAAVMVTEPDLLVLDEPTTLLDLPNSRRVRAAISALDAQVVAITHDLDLLADFDRVLVVHEGRICYDSTPADAIAHYKKLWR
jgi:biotin transport system ATP-binding protein